MAVQTSSEAAFDTVSWLGVAIRFVDGNRTHSGFLIKLDDQPTMLCHFAWHRDLRFFPPSNHYLWADAGLDQPNREYLAAWIGNLHQNAANIPYGLDANGSCFDRDTGQFLPLPVGKGLTCATFMIAVLKSLGYPFLKEDEWQPRRDDLEFQQAIVDALARDGADPAHIAGVQNDVGAKRFRPEEVVGAGTIPDWPVGFQNARTVADQILLDLAAAEGDA
jgi:hypothetical protein